MAPKAQSGETWIAAYEQRSDLEKFGSAGLALFAMALEFGYDDLETIGADAVVDGPDDRGCDVVFVDKDKGVLIVAQSYRSKTMRQEASAAKAATLRQAVSYLVEADMKVVPARLQASAEAVRAALKAGEIESVHVWFVHNCPGSKNVKTELKAVESTASAIIKTHYKEYGKLNVSTTEISSEILERLYTETSTPILVDELIEFETPSGFRFQEGEWKCFVAPVQLSLLKNLYDKHKTKLFSANVRDFLGMRAGESNINFQMQKSLASSPDNFFVYNNGLTILTHNISLAEEDGKKLVKLSGFSIVNGPRQRGRSAHLIQRLLKMPMFWRALFQLRAKIW